MDIVKIPFHKHSDPKGDLVYLEGSRTIPFDVKRIYYIYGVPAGERRGFHAHKRLQQVLICIHGACKILLDDGNARVDVTLSDPSEGLLVGNAMWREMYDFSTDAVLLVLASEFYDEQDYIRDYQQFKKYLEVTQK